MMKIVDERGRLFSKINIIDLLVILVLFSFFPVAYMGYRIIVKQATEKKTEFVVSELDCNFIKLEPETVGLIAVGDKELDEKGEVIGEIISLGESTTYQYDYYIDIAKRQKILEKDLTLKQIPARLRLKVEIRAPQELNLLYYKEKQICKNSTIEFATDKYKAEVAVLFERQPVEDQSSKHNLILNKKITSVSDRIGAQETKTNSLQHMINKLPDKIDTLHKSQDNKINILQKQVEEILSTPKINKLIEKERKKRSRGK